MRLETKRHGGCGVAMNLPVLTAVPAQPRRSRLIRSSAGLAWLAGCLLWAPLAHAETKAVSLPMSAEHWTVEGETTFQPHLGTNAALIRKGVMVANGVTFQDGTIEFDVDAESMGAGIGFRWKDSSTFECLYLRPNPMSPGASDALQYTPQSRGVLLWDLFPHFQAAAPLREHQWNHVRLVISGQRMDVYINGAQAPTLRVGRLEGDVSSGALLLQGPGNFANFVVTPERVDGLDPVAEKDSTDDDPQFVRHWRISPFRELSGTEAPTAAAMPDASANWTSITAERRGLINVSREYGLPLNRPKRAVAWLKTAIRSDRARTVQVAIGWSREVWVFVNGQVVFADKNLYNPAAARKTPDGRCSLENGSFALPLQAGENDVTVALANNFYGWGLIWRMDNLEGLELPKP